MRKQVHKQTAVQIKGWELARAQLAGSLLHCWIAQTFWTAQRYLIPQLSHNTQDCLLAAVPAAALPAGHLPRAPTFQSLMVLSLVVSSRWQRGEQRPLTHRTLLIFSSISRDLR